MVSGVKLRAGGICNRAAAHKKTLVRYVASAFQERFLRVRYSAQYPCLHPSHCSIIYAVLYFSTDSDRILLKDTANWYGFDFCSALFITREEIEGLKSQHFKLTYTLTHPSIYNFTARNYNLRRTLTAL